jgi:hypothetical protein
LSKQQIHLYEITSVNTLYVSGFYELLLGCSCDNIGWQHLPGELYKMPMMQEKDLDIPLGPGMFFPRQCWMGSLKRGVRSVGLLKILGSKLG